MPVVDNWAKRLHSMGCDFSARRASVWSYLNVSRHNTRHQSIFEGYNDGR